MHDISHDKRVDKFLTYENEVINGLWDNTLFALTDAHIKDNTHLVRVFPKNVKNTQFSVLYCHDILQVKPQKYTGKS
jgi:predicted porin